jgi:tetratricopeptide (TPR) repeat protein
MAPEQLAGRSSDARADLFAFCVTMYEALFGRRPFGGGSIDELRREIESGPPRVPSGPPEGLRAALRAGLHADPERRPPSMRALLDDVERSRRRRRSATTALVVSAALLLFAGATYGMMHRDRCRGAARLDGIWDLGRRAAVERAFAATHLSYGADLERAAAAALDSYTRSWVTMHDEACHATERGEQSRQLLDLRMQCLDERLREVDGLVGVLASADAPLVRRAPDAVAGLSNLAACADARALTQAVPPPKDAKLRADVERLRGDAARAKPLFVAGRFKDAMAIAKPTADAARKLGYRPLEAEALYLLGSVQHGSGLGAEAHATLADAVLAADAGRDDEVKARAATLLVFVAGVREHHTDEAIALARQAAAAIERFDHRDDLEGQLENHLGAVTIEAQHWDEAAEHLRRAVAHFERNPGPENVLTGRAMVNLALALTYRDELDEAERLTRRSLEILQKGLGAQHPEIAAVYGRLSFILGRRGRWQDALEMARRGLHVSEQALEPGHFDLTFPLSNVGTALRHLKRYDEALEMHRRELAILEKQLGPNDPEIAITLDSMGEAARDSGRLDEAWATLHRGLELREHGLKPDDPYIGMSLFELGSVRARQKRLDEALELERRALPLLEKLGDGYEVGTALVGLGEIEIARREGRSAIRYLERAEKIRAASPADPGELDEVRVALAKARSLVSQ